MTGKLCSAHICHPPVYYTACYRIYMPSNLLISGSNIYIQSLSLSVIHALSSQKEYQSSELCKSILHSIDSISEPMALTTAIKILSNQCSFLTAEDVAKVIALDQKGLEHEISSFIYKATKCSLDTSVAIPLLLKYICLDEESVNKYAATTLYNLSLIKSNVNKIQSGLSNIVKAFCEHAQKDSQCNSQHIQSEMKLMKSLLTDEAISASIGIQ